MDKYRDCGERFLGEKGIDVKYYVEHFLGLHRYEIFTLTDGTNFHRSIFYFDKDYRIMSVNEFGSDIEQNQYIIAIVLGHLGVVKC